MEKKWNPTLDVGDRIECLYMEGEIAVSPGTKGTVNNVTRDPFNKGEYIISVKWDNKSSLNLLSSTDVWKKVPPKLNEQDGNMDVLIRNREVLRHFDWKFLREFLRKIRESGIINMWGASPLIYAGRDHIERYYGEGREDDDIFQDLLDHADEARYKMVNGTLNYLESKDKDKDDLDLVNRTIRKLAANMLEIYIALSGITGHA